MKKTSVVALFFLLSSLLIWPLVTMAGSKVDIHKVNLAEGQTIDGNYYAIGDEINIAGRVNGDVLCFGDQVKISGQVDGDVLCLAKNLVIAGQVEGSVRAIADWTNIEGWIGRNLTMLSSRLQLSSESMVRLDAVFAAGESNLLGTIGGGVWGVTKKATLAGQVGGNVDLMLQDGYRNAADAALVITSDSKINGNLTYEARYDAAVADRLSIAGQIVKQQSDGVYFNPLQSLMGWWLWLKIICIIGALLTGLLIMILFKKQAVCLVDRMVERPMINIGWGLLLVHLVPLLVIFLGITIVGLPLAVILGLLWLALVMLAKPLAAIMVGVVALGRYRHKAPKNKARADLSNPIATMALGVAITYFLFAIPFVGSILSLIAVSWTIGAAWMLMKDLSLKK